MQRLTASILVLGGILATTLPAAFPERPADREQPARTETRLAQANPPRGSSRDQREREPFDRGRPPGFGPGGFSGGPPRGGFPGGIHGEERKLVAKFDDDGNGRLDTEERSRARQSLGDGPGNGRSSGRFGGRRGATRKPGRPGPKVSPEDVVNHPDAALYDLDVLRTLFLEFENSDWEDELEAFKGSDVEVPAVLTVDGRRYEGVGVHFRGASSFHMVPAGLKRSLNLSLDFVDDEQRLYGYKTLNLLNCNGDPSMMSTVLYSHIARRYMPAPRANFVRVVINGESWGVYANVQQFNKEFVKENYGSRKGERWKVPGRPNGDSGLAYVGENIDEYKRRYEIKSGDDEQAWTDLIALCRTLDQTPPDRLEAALEPILDIDEVLWFLALDVALVNEDGYWTRASDYSIYQDKEGRFHIIPHDMNEAFHGGGHGGGPGGPPPFGPPRGGGFRGRPNGPPGFGPGGAAGGPGAFRGPGGPGGPGNIGPGAGGPGAGGPGAGGPGPGGVRGSVTLDPTVALDDPRKPLRSKLLAVPALRQKYLDNVRTIARDDLDWESLGPIVSKLRRLIVREVRADTRKLFEYSEFVAATSDRPAAGTGRHLPLRTFAGQRREYLLKMTEPTASRR